MKLTKVIQTLQDLDKMGGKKPNRVRLNIKKVILECHNEITLTFGDKLKKPLKTKDK